MDKCKSVLSASVFNST